MMAQGRAMLKIWEPVNSIVLENPHPEGYVSSINTPQVNAAQRCVSDDAAWTLWWLGRGRALRDTQQPTAMRFSQCRWILEADCEVPLTSETS